MPKPGEGAAGAALSGRAPGEPSCREK